MKPFATILILTTGLISLNQALKCYKNMDFTQDSSSYSFTEQEEEITCSDEAKCSKIEKSAIALCKVEPTSCWVGLDSRFPDKILRNCYSKPHSIMKAPGCKNETHFDLSTQNFLENTNCFCREDLCNTDNSFNFPYFK